MKLLGLGFSAAVPALDGIPPERLFWRTVRHPAAAGRGGTDLEPEIRRRGFEAATAFLLAREDAVFAVPGDPLLGEAAVRRLHLRARAEGVSVEVLPGESLLSLAVRLLDLDPSRGPVLWDLAEGDPGPFAGEILLLGVEGREAKLREWLATYRPGERAVFVGSGGVHPLDAIPDAPGGVYLPARADAVGRIMDELRWVMARLRSPEGCPWDREQDHRSLVPHLLEEAYEVIEAIEGGDAHKLREELGDLLLQVVFHAQLSAEEAAFNLREVAEVLVGKLRHRHPWVFGETAVTDAADAILAWEELKRREPAAEGRSSALDGVPSGLPALQSAWKLGQKAARAGFDWPDASSAWPKVEEELGELRAAMVGEGPERTAEEVGDVLFAVANLARLLGVEPETALRGALSRFVGRFRRMEEFLRASGREPRELTLSDWDRLWEEAKREK